MLITLIFSCLLIAWFNAYFEPAGADGRTIPNTGAIYVKGLEIYGGDITSAAGNVTVDWGELFLGTSKNASFYVKSNSNINVTLGLNVTNWKPTGIEKYLTVSWDYDGTLLNSTQTIFVTLNLRVPSSQDFIDFLIEKSVTAFGFDMTIYASGE